MITIHEPKKSERGIKCNMCNNDILVKELNFRADGATGGTSIFLCDRCRDKLIRKLVNAKIKEMDAE